MVGKVFTLEETLWLKKKKKKKSSGLRKMPGE